MSTKVAINLMGHPVLECNLDNTTKKIQLTGPRRREESILLPTPFRTETGSTTGSASRGLKPTSWKEPAMTVEKLIERVRLRAPAAHHDALMMAINTEMAKKSSYVGCVNSPPWRRDQET